MRDFKFMLAPMEDVAGAAFRTVCHKYGADLTFTEMIRVTGLIEKNRSALQKIQIKDETPTVIQLFGLKEEEFSAFMKEYIPEKGFSGFNLNLGCPDPQLIRQGLGCAMMRRISKTKKIIDVIKNHGYNASVKMRLGMTQRDKENKAYLNLINGVDADYFIVHSRHGAQTYNDKAEPTIYEECVKTGKEIIANGDIKSQADIDFLRSVGVKGAMIGREAVKNPAIFNQLKGLSMNTKEAIQKEITELSQKYGEDERYKKNIFKNMNSESAPYRQMR